MALALPLPSQQYLLDTFCYDSQSGELRWRERTDAPPNWNGHYAGKVAGSKLHGLVNVVLGSGRFKAHRIVWKMIHGTEPDEIDHKDGNPLNNRIENLRSCSRVENARNTKCRSVCGLKGVSIHAKTGLWRARLRVDGKEKCLGYFKTPEDAYAAYKLAAPKYYGEFARLA